MEPGLVRVTASVPSPLSVVPSFVRGLGGKGVGAFPAGEDSFCLHLNVGGEATGHRPWEPPDSAAVWEMISHNLFSSRCNHCVQWRPDHALLGDEHRGLELGGYPGQWQVEGKKLNFVLVWLKASLEHTFYVDSNSGPFFPRGRKHQSTREHHLSILDVLRLWDRCLLSIY